MANLKYNFVNDNFLVYEASPESPKVEIDLPVLDSPLDISDWAYKVTKDNIPIIKDDGFLSNYQKELQDGWENRKDDKEGNSEGEFGSEKTWEDFQSGNEQEESNTEEELETTEEGPIIEDIPQEENTPQELPKVINAPTRVEVPGLDVSAKEKESGKKNWDKATSRERQVEAMKYFSSVEASLPEIKGQILKPYQAAAIVGNLMYESGQGSLNTRAKGDKGTALGIAQWRLDRRKGLEEFAKAKGTSIYDFNTQLEYVWHELNNKERKALLALLKTKNVEDATKVFMETFERPNLRTPEYGGLKIRVKYAKSCLS